MCNLEVSRFSLVQNGIVVVQNNGKKIYKKCAASANLFIC